MSESRLRVAVVEPQPGIEARVRTLVDRAGAEAVGPDDEHDVALVFADAGAEGWAWTVEQWLHRGTPVLLTRLRRVEGSAADLTAVASIPRPFGSAELEAAFVEIREHIAAGGAPRDPDPTQPVPSDLRPEIEATHDVFAEVDAAIAADEAAEADEASSASEAGASTDSRTTAVTPVAGVEAVGDATDASALRPHAQAAAQRVESWAALEGDARVDAIEAFLANVVADLGQGASSD